ncbi:two-component system, NarL family, sensor histidine kinase EvgS [Gammaproteobacteria bacterium]|nr:two-component system, NarL family, sensor histidine kinase EvgS [Gammaproteobacteria bacterium]
MEQQLQSLRRIALAVARPSGPAMHAELVRELAEALAVPLVFAAVFEDGARTTLRTLAAQLDGRPLAPRSFLLVDAPAASVPSGIGAGFRYLPTGAAHEWPAATVFGADGLDAGAACPLADSTGAPIGLLVAMNAQAIAGGDAQHTEAMLKLVAGRLSAGIERDRFADVPRTTALARSDTGSDSIVELERLAASEPLQRSAASYRTIFEAAEDAIFIHDWDSGEIIDVNTRACETFGWSREEFSHLPVAEICAGTPPYTAAEALHWIQLAKLDRCPPFEWLSRNKDGSLHWDEVRLKPATIAGRPHVLAFARDITERKNALAALQAQEQKYRAIFDGSVDAMVLWSEALVVVDVNDAFVHTTGMTREQVIGRPWRERIDAADIERLLPLIRGALDGREQRAIERVSRADGSLFDIELRYLPVRLGEARYALGVGRDVSEQLEHERELVRSAARLGATVEAAFDGVITMDGEGRIVEFNAAAERVFGHRREEVVGRKLGDVLLPERHRMAHARGLANFHRSGSGPMIGRLVETTALHADGREIPVEMAISVATVPEGSIFVGHLRDITERRRGDQALRDSEQQYRAIFNASADALVLRAADFSIVDVNATYEAMSGYARAEVLGVARVLANPPEVMATIRALHERALAGEAVTLETRLLRRDGQSYDLELRGVPIVHRGEPHVLYIGRDITQAKHAERALRDSEEQYRAIFNASADALVLRGADFRAVEVNPAYTTMSGFTRDEVMAADRVLTQADAAVRARHRAEHELALGGQQLRFEVTATRQDGSTLQAEVRGTPMMYRGQPHVLYAVRDITERNAAERRRVELERQLRQAQKMEAIGQLTGGIAHDFNNILASVIGYVVLAQERAEALADATLVRQLGQAHLAADRARELIAQMLAFARRQRGERRVLALTPLLQQTLTLLRATLPSTVSLQVDVPPADGLGRADVPCVEADPVQLEQVLFNLCINARDAIGGQGRIGVQLRAAPAGSTWLCASCRAAVAEGQWVELAVEDDGPGVAPDVVERIFDPFFSTKAPGRGSGMGLAMVHGIVHDHGGHIQLSAAPGGGARFGVWLPLADAASAQRAAAPDVLPSSAALSGRVLLVEDDRMVGDFLAERLTGWGLQVQLQRDAAAAAAWLCDLSNSVDLLITDQTMPLLTGLQLAQRVNARRPQLPIVLVSGNASAFDPDELARCGIAAALPKPIDNARLRATLRRLRADTAAERAAP